MWFAVRWLGFKEGKLAADAGTRGKAPWMVGIWMSVLNSLPKIARFRTSKQLPINACGILWMLMCWVQELNMPLISIDIHWLYSLIMWHMWLTNEKSIEIHKCERPLVRTGLGWSSADHQIHRPSACKSLPRAIRYGDGSKPYPPVVHIKIAGKWMWITP